MLGVGPKQPDALLIGESPSHDDARENEPLAANSATGKELQHVLDAAGLIRDRLFFLNVIACVPNEPRRDKEVKKAMACCRPLLLATLAKLPPETPTLVMGTVAQQAVDQTKRSIAKLRGFVEYEWTLDDALKASGK